MQHSKILIIEDDQDVADSIQMLCKEMGHDALVAYDGATGLKMAAAEKPELILSDIAMPGLDGFEVARRVRSNHDLDKTAIVAVTGTLPRRPAKNQYTFDDYVIKPFMFEELEKVIKKFTTEEPKAE
jgi:DNA-binding response OmpR family regulator